MMKRFFAVVAFVAFLSVSARSAEAIEQQRATNWCWASVINDAISATGNYRSQEQIAADLSGWPQDRPAYIQEVVGLLTLYGFKAWQTGRPATYEELYRTLAGGWWITAFVRPTAGPVGHYINVKGYDPSSGYVWIADPATGQEGLIHPDILYAMWQDAVVVGRGA